MNKNASNMSKSKIDRLLAIREIIASKDISSQEDLLVELASQGYNLTQATLSRDIKELQIAKVPDGMGNYRYRISPNVVSRQVASPLSVGETESDITRNWAVSLEFSGQVAVLKTRPGYASVVADIVDKSQSEGIMGTLAGDDTVLLILRSSATQASVVRSLSQWLPNIESKVL